MDWLQDVSGTSTTSIGLLSNPESDEYLPTLLQHLLVTVERGIERIECETVRKPWICNHVCSESSARCHNASVNTKEISVQTSLLNSSVVVTGHDLDTVQGDGMNSECQPILSSDANGNHSNSSQSVDSQGNCANNYDNCFIELPGNLENPSSYLDLTLNDKVSGCSSDTSECADNQNQLSDLSETVVKEKCYVDSTQTINNQDTPSDMLQNIQDKRELSDLFETVVSTETNKESSSANTSSSVSDDSPEVTSLPSTNKEPIERDPANSFKEEDPDDGYYDNTLSKPHCISQVDPDLLHSEIACLPGSRDISGRSVVVIFHSVFREFPKVVPSELARLLIYFHSVPRKEVIALGFCVLIDGHKSENSDWTVLDETFCLVEANIPNAISTVVVYANNEVISRGESLFPSSGFKYNVAVDVEHLHRYIQRDQLFPRYSGNYKYDHQEWISFRMFLEPFISGCQLSGRHLVTVMQDIRGSRLPPTASLTSQVIEQQKRIINQAFQDEQLRHLVEEGDTVLNELESYGRRTPYNHDYKDSLAKGSALHGELKKATAKLAILADRRLKKLEQCLQLKTFEEETHQVLDWLCHAGQDALDKHQTVADTLPGIKGQEEEFDKFYFLAMRQLEKGNDLLEDAAAFNPKVSSLTADPPVVVDNGGHGDVQELADTLKDHMNTFTERLEDTRERLEDTTKCYHFLDRSYEWALETMKFVSKMKVEQLSTSGLVKMLKQLQDYLEDHPPITDEVFQEMLNLATKLENKKLLDQCKAASARCQETMELIQTRRSALLKAKQHQEIGFQHQQELWEPDSDSSSQANFHHHHSWTPQSTSTPTASSISSSGFYRRRSIATSSPQSHSSLIGSYTAFPSNYNPMSGLKDCHSNHSIDDKEDHILSQGLITEDLTTQGPVASISLSKLEARSTLAQKEAQPYGVFKSHSGSSLVGLKERIIGSIAAGAASIQNSSKEGSSHHRPLKKLMRKCQTWQLCEEALQRATSEVREQNEKLKIDQMARVIDSFGENVSNVVEIEDTSSSSRCSVAHTLSDPGMCSSPVPVNSHLARTANSSQPEDLDQQTKRKKTLLHIMREMIQTEKDYVKSLEYIIENYLPELLREDIPQALRGQRNVIFGNIEKIYEFHNHHFLSQLEECENLPFLVGQCFLAYEPQFYLYALYNKNKPKSEALMVEYGNAFFKKKQLELGDKMNLASYLLKPVQRMGKYALLLKQLLKECPEREPEHEDLKAAEEMVRFQLRHGNDLLTMDALRECDVNLKEQGKLLRQDEFLVWQGRSRKSLRHIFLFEDLVLFSKARRDPEQKGQEIYQYKLSFKMTDIGMTEQVGDSPTKFEIWFRKRKQNDTYVLQAPNPEVKQAWVVEISKLLWKQALRNREMRLAEMSCMGIGSKPCLDIKPNEDQISDRAINFQQLGRAFRFRNSIAVSSFDQLRNNNKRPHSTISVSSSSSSGSSHASYLHHGSLNLGFEPGDDSFRQCCRSITQQSQCSTESGISTDLSMASDSCGESERPRYKKAERSDSLLSNDSVITHLPISEYPVAEDQLLEETETTSM
ncbi:puratrophin-1-like [Tachypleus tridentatus]|uniref:puratrophin-1-like n=1 Tax=Tachypleus tridentatus TaxID=6853 RepID=UPI003FD22F9B